MSVTDTMEDAAAPLAKSKVPTLAEMIARVRNLNLPSVAESAEHLFALLKADAILFNQIAEKLVEARCLEVMRMHHSHVNLVIWSPKTAPRIAVKRIEQVRTEAMTNNLRIAQRQMREQLMNLRLCGGNVQLRDASKRDIEQHCHFMRRQIQGELSKLKFFEAIAAQMKDGERVFNRFTEADLDALRAAAVDNTATAMEQING